MSSWQRYVTDHPRVGDAALVAVLLAAAVLGSLPGSAAWWPAVLCSAVGCAALPWRREHPRAVVVVTGACALAVAGLGYLVTVPLLAPLMTALYALAVRADRATIRGYALVTTGLVVAVAVLAGPAHRSVTLETVGPAAWLLLPPALGAAGRLRQACLEAVRARAEHAERTREEVARHRVAEERVRIARELHDVVAHHLALANAQAGTAAHLVRGDPAHAERLLADLAGTTSSALRELRAAVGLLRQAGDPAAPLEPAPGLDRLPDLTATLAGAGLAVAVATDGTPRPLSPGADVAAFRIVQEALTNVSKHTAAPVARVRLGYRPDRLAITVTDDGGGPSVPVPPAGDGFGLIGMRERAHSVGGRLSAGRRPGGGFEVTAELPLPTQHLEEDRST